MASKCGSMDGVSYVLMLDQKEFMFRGYPDFTVHYESDTIANRILLVMQSTRDLATQIQFMQLVT